MDRQPTLFDRPDSIEDRFWAYHRANPEVYERLRDMALRLRRRGWARYSIKALFEVIRWEDALDADDPNAAVKLNNVYTSRYARLLMRQEPELRGFFETRTLQSS